MSKPDVMLDWARQNGIDREKWRAAYNSDEVNRKIELAKKLTRDYNIQGTPSFVVDGRYLIRADISTTCRNPFRCWTN